MALGHSRGSETASLFPEGLVLGLTQLSHTQCVCPLPGTPTQAALGEVSLQGSGAHLLLPCPSPHASLGSRVMGPSFMEVSVSLGSAPVFAEPLKGPPR